MKLLNYTGKRIGLTNEVGSPIEVLPSDGFARCETSDKKAEEVGRVPIYQREFGRIRNLPDPDPNCEKFYIVTKQIAEAAGNFRMDLLIPEDPFQFEGAVFYRKLIKV